MIRADITRPEPAPVTREGAPSMHDLAAALHLDRRDHGETKCGTLLQAFNGRRVRVDKVQETLDHLVYELQDLVEATAREGALAEYRGRLRLLVIAGGSAADAADLCEELLNPAAVEVRADAIASALIAGSR